MAISKGLRASRENWKLVGSSANKENAGPASASTAPERGTSRSKTEALRELQETRSALSDLGANHARLQTRCDTFQRTSNRYKGQVRALRTDSAVAGCSCSGAPMVSRAEYAALCDVLDLHKRQLSSVRRELRLLRDRLRRAQRSECAAVAKAVAAAKMVVVKHKGKVPHPVRALIRNWSIICNVPSKKVFPCMRMFCETFGLTLRGMFSHGLVGLTILEGGLAARLQIADAVKDANGQVLYLSRLCV